MEFRRNITLKEATGKEAFKVSWRKFKEVDKTCSVEGKDSDVCKRMAKEIGIEWHDE